MKRRPQDRTSRRPGVRWPRAAAGAVIVIVLLSAAGSAEIDRGAAGAAAFDQTYARYQQWFLGEQDERGLAWSHWQLQVGSDRPERASQETDYLRVGQGDQRATLVGERNTEPGWSIDVLHPAGSAADYVLVGDAFRRPARPSEAGPRGPLVSTPWIARPAKGPGRWSPCITSATLLFCSIDQALARSRLTLPGLPAWVEDNPDGTRMARTAIRLADLVAEEADPLDNRRLATVAPLLPRLVPLTITETAGGQFMSMRLGGRLDGPGVFLEIDEGLEYRGPAVASDIPNGPRRADEVTVMDEPTYTRFATEVRSRTASG